MKAERVSCARCAGSWDSPSPPDPELLRKIQALYAANRVIQAFKALQEEAGLNLGSAKAILHHFAGPNCTCHRCHAPLGGGMLAVCLYCRSLNYDPCGVDTHHPETSADNCVRALFGSYDEPERADEWLNSTSSLAIGNPVEGRVVLVFHFGVFVDLGVGFPALLEVTEFDHRSRRREEKPEWPRVGETINARIAHINPNAHVIRLSQRLDTL